MRSGSRLGFGEAWHLYIHGACGRMQKAAWSSRPPRFVPRRQEGGEVALDTNPEELNMEHVLDGLAAEQEPGASQASEAALEERNIEHVLYRPAVEAKEDVVNESPLLAPE